MGFSLFFVLNCNNKPSAPQAGAAVPPKTTPVAAPGTAVGHVYGNHFSVYKTDSYETLLSVCRRCQTGNLTTYPGGFTYHWELFGKNYRKCKHWNSAGYLQIEFAEKKLPTKATISIWPKLNNYDRWGVAFSVTGNARPINKNSGFQVLVNFGAQALNIYSDDSNHVKDRDLEDVLVTNRALEQAHVLRVNRLNNLNKKRAVSNISSKCF